MSPIAQNTFRPIPHLISCAGVTSIMWTANAIASKTDIPTADITIEWVCYLGVGLMNIYNWSAHVVLN